MKTFWESRPMGGKGHTYNVGRRKMKQERKRKKKDTLTKRVNQMRPTDVRRYISRHPDDVNFAKAWEGLIARGKRGLKVGNA